MPDEKRIAIVIGGPMDGQIIETDLIQLCAGAEERDARFRFGDAGRAVRVGRLPGRRKLVVYYRCHVSVILTSGVFDVNAFMVDDGCAHLESIGPVEADSDIGKLAIKALLQGL